MRYSDIVKESASVGATGSSNVAASNCGFDGDYSRSNYPPPKDLKPEKKKKKIKEAFTPLPSDWDLGGAWITDNGNIELCDHSIDRHHSDIALEYFDDYVETNDEGEYDDYSRDSALDIAFESHWIRIGIRGKRSISFEWKAKPTDKAKKSLIKFISDLNVEYEQYEVEDCGKYKQFPGGKKGLLSYIRRYM